MKVLIDTNIIIDAVNNRTPFNVSAEKIFLLCAADSMEGIISASCITDIYCISRKYYQSIDKAKEIIIKLFDIFTICDITKADLQKAFNLPIKDYEDALIAQCASRSGCTVIVTRNIKDFEYSPVKALSPDDFLKQFFPDMDMGK
jgi:predicted nucleic acid-binding protein